MYQITFQRGCNTCMQTTGITQIIMFDGYDKILNSDQPGSLHEQDVKKLIQVFYDEKQFNCEVCGAINKFSFYEIEVNGKPVKQINSSNHMTHQDILSEDKVLVIKFKKINQVVLEIDTSTGKIKDSKLDNENRGGLLEVNKTYVKAYETIRDTHMKEVFIGQITNIKFSSDGQILEIEGGSQSWIDASNVSFKIIKGVSTIGTYQIKESDNYYIDIEPSGMMPKFKSNFLLATIEISAPIGN